MSDQFRSLKVIVNPQVEALSKFPSDGQKKCLAEAAHRADERQQQAVRRTALLLGTFRKCDADAPEIFSAAIEDVLARYDPDIQREATRPGIWKYPPTAYELREACEAIANERARATEREARVIAQLAERTRLDAMQAERPALLTYKSTDALARPSRVEFERIEAERILGRYQAEAQASAARAGPSVFELDPDNWDA